MMATDTGIASGAIANCTDGADEVPVVKWEAQARSFSGVSSVEFNHGNKNLIMPPQYSDSTISLCADMGADIKVSYITLSFLATNALALSGSGALVDYRESNGTHHYRTVIGFKDSNGNYFQANVVQNGYFSNTYSNISFRYIYIYYMKNSYDKFQTNCLSKWQVEIGQVRTDFVKTLKSSDTAQLGRTVYGAKLNLASGTGTENMVRVKISDLNWTYYTGGTNPIFYAQNVPNLKMYSRGELPNIRIQGFNDPVFAQTRSYQSKNLADLDCSVFEDTSTITFCCTAYTSREDMLAAIGDNYIIYETTQTTDFTFNPILKPETYLGVNNFWIDCGDSSVEYYKSGYGYTSVTLNRRISKNFIDNSDDAWESGTINASGVNASGNGTRTKGYFPVIGGLTYCISGITAPSTTSDFRMFYYDANKTFLSYRNYSSSWVFPSNVAYIRFRNLTDIDISNLQLEIGSTPSSYEPYSVLAKTAKLHRLIYEGSVDVIRGIGTISVGESGTEYDPPEQISFTPVEIATDEGENTFYADEGVSVITYRRGVE